MSLDISPSIRSDWEDDTKACTVVQALSGFGKTYVYRMLADEDEHSIWIEADIRDDDPDHFLRKIEAAWEQIDEATMDIVGGSAVESVWDRVDALTDRMFHWQDTGSKIHLVIDDVQSISDLFVWELLLFIIKKAGTYIHFFLLTDVDAPKPLRRLIRQGEVTVITENELRLIVGARGSDPSSDEGLIETGKISSDRELSDSLPTLIRSFLGWPYGVMKAAEKIKRSEAIDLHLLLRETGLNQAISDVMWEPLSAEMKSVLSQVAILDEFNWELCDAVTEGEVSRSQFEEMISLSYMVERIREGEEWYRFGDAYATFLRERISEKEKREICVRAAQWCRQVGDYAGMVNYAIGGHSTELLIEVMEQRGSQLLAGRSALGRIIRYLEEEGVRFTTVASGIAGQYYYAEGNMERMEEYLNAADSAFGKENRYAAYRSIYRALSRYDADPVRYEKQLRSALFFLREEDEPMPWLKPESEKRLERMLREGESGERSLLVESLGGFRVIAARDNKEIAWRTRKGRELFAYLTDLRGETVDRRKLMEILWPEEIPANAVAMLHNMIYNIRKELSDYSLEGILVYENKRYRLYTEDLKNSADALYEIVDPVEHQDMGKLREKEKYFLEFHGRYLEDIDAAWADERREYYDRIYRRGCELLAEDMVTQDKCDEAIRLYHNIQKLDPYDEYSAERLLHLYGKKREWDAMKKFYDAFCKRLSDELGIEPGEAVVSAYEKGRMV
ncbi:MAG: hypothetical protein II915_03505 [Eubacterium sp.]|nr:hypothetical protein [Eubacterium sp.]